MKLAPAILAILPLLGAAAEEPGRDLPSPLHESPDQPLILAPGERERVDAVAEQLICYCGCARQTVSDCACGVADRIKRSIWEELERSVAPERIVDAYVTEHGSQFRSAPERRGLGLIAWTVPYGALLVAGSMVLLVVRRWTRRPAATPVPADEPRDAYQERVERELRDLE